MSLKTKKLTKKTLINHEISNYKDGFIILREPNEPNETVGFRYYYMRILTRRGKPKIVMRDILYQTTAEYELTRFDEKRATTLNELTLIGDCTWYGEKVPDKGVIDKWISETNNKTLYSVVADPYNTWLGLINELSEKAVNIKLISVIKKENDNIKVIIEAIAIKNISPGDEITWYYGPDYPRKYKLEKSRCRLCI